MYHLTKKTLSTGVKPQAQDEDGMGEIGVAGLML